MNKKVTEIYREDLEELFGAKMSNSQWKFFCDVLHEKVVPNLFEQFVFNKSIK